MQTLSLELNGKLLQRGFWLYVWEITTPEKKILHYVGRTGDSSSINTASPFSRTSQHLDPRETAKSAMLTKHLAKQNIPPQEILECIFKLTAVGPIYQEHRPANRKSPKNVERDEHNRLRDLTAAMERELANALSQAGYEVINTVNSHMSHNEETWRSVLKEFTKSFPNLKGLIS